MPRNTVGIYGSSAKIGTVGYQIGGQNRNQLTINFDERKFSDTGNALRATFTEMCQLTYVVFCFIYDCSIRPQKIGLDHCVLDL